MLLVGAREMEANKVTVKDMGSGEQEQIPIETVAEVLLNRINQDNA